MSMLSAQCDELRAMAESVGLAVPQAATLMMEAADTILSLRDRAQDLQAENAKLREELEAVGTAAYAYGRGDLKTENDRLREKIEAAKHDLSLFSGELVASKLENAKLRELVRDYERCTMHADCSRCEYDGKLSTHCPLSPCFPDADELRELGVEDGR